MTEETNTYSRTSPITNTDCVYVVNNGSQTSTTLTSQLASIGSSVSGKQDSSTAVTHTASTTVGSATQPVYISSTGEVTPTTYSLGKSVPSDAVFTDTTYSAFTGSNGTSAGSSGLVPAPTATDNTKFLKGDGTWATPSGGNSLPSQTGQSGKYLTTDGTDASWGTLPIVSSVSSSSTNSDAVGAKLFYDTCGDIESLINAL